MVSTPVKTAGRRTKTGIALSTTELRAADVRLRGTDAAGWHTPLDPPDPTTGAWPSLLMALRELATALGVEGGQLVVALMPPLTEVRRLELPPLKDDELYTLLARNAGKYFLTARDPQIVGGTYVARRAQPETAGSSIVGAAASARLVSSINAAAKGAGWVVDALVPAEAGWRAAALSLWPSTAKGTAHMLVAHDDRTDLLLLENGQLAAVRRFRGGAADADLIAEAINATRQNGTPPKVVAVGAGVQRRELAQALSTRGAIVSAPPAEWTTAADDPALVAASFASPNRGLVLRTEAAVAARRARARFATMYVVIAAVLVFVVAAFVQLWGVKRQSALVQAQRALIQPQVAKIIQGRESFHDTYQKLAGLVNAERGAPHWARVIYNITTHLPTDAYVIGLRIAGDTIVIEGKGANAADVLDNLYNVPGLTGVRNSTPVNNDPGPNGAPGLDHFNIMATLIPPPQPQAASAAPRPAPRPVSTGGKR